MLRLEMVIPELVVLGSISKCNISHNNVCDVDVYISIDKTEKPYPTIYNHKH